MKQMVNTIRREAGTPRYRQLDKEINTGAKKDKQNYLNDLATQTIHKRIITQQEH